MSQSTVITIDGPSASGKTSVSRNLANKMGWSWVSTGAFYRGLAYVASNEKVDLADQAALAALASDPIWSVEPQKNETSVMYRGVNVTLELGKERVGMVASQISQYPEVRKALLAAQRACAESQTLLVAEGRDCGTVVFPGAILKVYLTASLDLRAQRRSLEEGKSVEDQKNLQQQRDQSDEKRTEAPLQVPEGGHVVDSSSLQLVDVVAEVEKLAIEALTKTNQAHLLPQNDATT